VTSSGGQSHQTTVSPHFKLIFIVIAIAFVASFVAYVATQMCIADPKTAGQIQGIDALDFVWKSTLGAILGLLGGKIP
jgi:hypothetical protein